MIKIKRPRLNVQRLSSEHRQLLGVSLTAIRQPVDDVEKHRRQKDAEASDTEHSEEDRDTERATHLEARSVGNDQRHDSENERERRHQDRAKAKLRRLERTFNEWSPSRDLHSRELNDKDRVLRG